MVMTRLLVYLLLGLLPAMLMAQPPAPMLQNINRSLETGNARLLAASFGQNVNLSMPRAEGTFSKSQAEIILRDFFSRHRPEGYRQHVQNHSDDGSIYLIGSLTTHSGQRFRVYIIIKQMQGGHVLHHLQFDAR